MTVIEWLSSNWITVLGGGSISGVIGYFLGGKKKQEQEIKKSDVEIDSAEVDYAVKVKDLYETLLTRANKEKDELKTTYDLIVVDFKNEIDELRKQSTEMQNQFNTIQLAYAKEVEMSQNWEKLHRELTQKHNDLEKAHEELKQFCNKLKQELDKYKKKTR